MQYLTDMITHTTAFVIPDVEHRHKLNDYSPTAGCVGPSIGLVSLATRGVATKTNVTRSVVPNDRDPCRLGHLGHVVFRACMFRACVFMLAHIEV